MTDDDRTEQARAWVRVVASALSAGVGTFMLIWQTVFSVTPNALLIGAGLVALGLPPAFRLDEKIRGKGD